MRPTTLTLKVEVYPVHLGAQKVLEDVAPVITQAVANLKPTEASTWTEAATRLRVKAVTVSDG